MSFHCWSEEMVEGIDRHVFIIAPSLQEPSPVGPEPGALKQHPGRPESPETPRQGREPYGSSRSA